MPLPRILEISEHKQFQLKYTNEVLYILQVYECTDCKEENSALLIFYLERDRLLTLEIVGFKQVRTLTKFAGDKHTTISEGLTATWWLVNPFC